MQVLEKEALEALERAETVPDFLTWRVMYLGKKGKLTKILQGMAALPPDERPRLGKKANQLRERLTQAGEECRVRLERKALQIRLQEEILDLTLPSPILPQGVRHPWMSIVEEIEDFFLSMGYRIAEGPEIENDHYNFTMLNLPPGHPARDMQDSFYLDDTWLLRTHTSPVQIRVMQQSGGQPLRIIAPGYVYRRDHDDATHTHQFGQIEGLSVDTDLTMGDLQGVLFLLLRHLFGSSVSPRVRCSYFPFTEPSIEIDVRHPERGWVEVLGAGMVHPHVLNRVGYDAERYSGFAFALGIERLIMLRHGIMDIRLLYENDLRLLTQLRGR